MRESGLPGRVVFGELVSGKGYMGEREKEGAVDGVPKRTSLFCDQIHRVLL